MTAAARLKKLAMGVLPTPVSDRVRAARQVGRDRAAAARREVRKAQRRQALLDADPEVRLVSTGVLNGPGRVVTDFTVEQAARHNLELVTTVLERAGVDYFMVRGRSAQRYVLGVHRRHRSTVFREMREAYRSSALYAVKPGAGGSVALISAYVDGALAKAIKTGWTVRFAEPLLSPAGKVVAGVEFGCDIEFWRDGVDLLPGGAAEGASTKLRCKTPPAGLEGALVAPRPNRVADVLPLSAQVPATRAVGGRSYPTFEPFTWTLMDDVTFPVDVVYTWVDGEDPRHAAKRAEHRGDVALGLAANASRYASHDELLYSLRSVHMYAPFVRNIYIVTDDQVPAWLDQDAPGITVVDHREIFPDDALPTFNSHAIGTRLHHIPGLADHYLYFNDDVFLARLRRAEDYFYANGIAKVPFSPAQFGVGDIVRGEVAPNSAGKNVRSLLAADFDRGITNKFKHAPHPQLREVMTEIEERYSEVVGRTTRSRFRSVEDVGFAATLHHHYALLTGRAVPGEARMSYVDIGSVDAAERLARLQVHRRVDSFCLNDVDTPEHTREAVHEMVGAFLEERFPFPSPWERSGA